VGLVKYRGITAGKTAGMVIRTDVIMTVTVRAVCEVIQYEWYWDSINYCHLRTGVVI